MRPTSLNQSHRLALAKSLVLLRRKQHIKRDYLAHKLGLSVASVHKLEQGVTSARFIDVCIICKALGAEIKDLIVLYEIELQKLHTPPEEAKMLR